MKIRLLFQRLGISAAAALLAACGASFQAPSADLGVMSQSSLAANIDRGESWMLPEAKGEDLLYITNPHPPASKVLVFSYPRGKLVGVLKHFGLPGAECSDKDGNVFIADGGIIEYAHGGEKPIQTLGYGGHESADCSSDPTTGNLAVTYDYGLSEGWVVIYRHARGTPTVYQMGNMVPFNCGYDNAGDLFVDGQPYAGSGIFDFAELPKNGSELRLVTLDRSFSWPGPVQWDGKYITVGDTGSSPGIIYRFLVSGSKGTSVGETSLDGPQPGVAYWWIQKKEVVAPYGNVESPAVYYWKYPAGGSAIKTITQDLVTPLGVTISVTPRQ